MYIAITQELLVASKQNGSLSINVLASYMVYEMAKMLTMHERSENS